MTQKEISDVHRNNNCKMNMMEPNLSKYQFIFCFQMKIITFWFQELQKRLMQYSSNRIRKTQNEHLNIVCQNLYYPCCKFKAFFHNFWCLFHILFDLNIIGVSYIIIWWLIFEKKSDQFWREVWIHVLVISLQLYKTCMCILIDQKWPKNNIFF